VARLHDHTRHLARPLLGYRSVIVAGLCLVNACGAGWHREEIGPEGDLPPRQQVQIWMGQRSRVLHAVRLGPDSLTGVPFHLPPDCDSCRVAMPSGAVDSIRLGSQERGALRSLGLGYVLVGVAGVLLYLSVDTD
jgi:hypothetical protein